MHVDRDDGGRGHRRKRAVAGTRKAEVTPAELDALRLEILERRRAGSSTDRAELDGLGADLDTLHERNTRTHGRARAELVRWTALMRSAEYVYRVCVRRKERAMTDAIEALDRARVAEEDEAKWLRVACWVARRVDGAASRVARRSRLVTRLDFNAAEEETEGLEPLDLEEEETPW